MPCCALFRFLGQKRIFEQFSSFSSMGIHFFASRTHAHQTHKRHRGKTTNPPWNNKESRFFCRKMQHVTDSNRRPLLEISFFWWKRFIFFSFFHCVHLFVASLLAPGGFSGWPFYLGFRVFKVLGSQGGESFFKQNLKTPTLDCNRGEKISYPGLKDWHWGKKRQGAWNACRQNTK